MASACAPAQPKEQRHADVEIYVASWCPYCKALEKFLNARDIPYTRYDIEHDSEGIKRYHAMGSGEIPIIKVKGKTVRGFGVSAMALLLQQ